MFLVDLFNVQAVCVLVGYLTFLRDQNLGVHFLANLDIDRDEIWYVATTCWFDEAHAKFLLYHHYSREKTLLL